MIKLDKIDSCLKCKYYTDTIGDQGYCKFYHHNITTPEVMCTKFEQKDTKNMKETGFDIKTVVTDMQQSLKADRKTALNRALLIAAIFSCAVFTVIAIIFAVSIGTTVLSFDTVDYTTKIIFLITVCIFLISVLVISFMLVHRFITMRLVYLVASILCVLFMLINNTTMWFNFHDLILTVLEAVFNIVY